MAWDYDGEYYKVPFPYKEGIRRWPVADWTRQYGAPGEIDDEGRTLGLGESVGAFRAVHFGKTEAEAVALLRDTNYAGFQNYFGGFGFWEAFRTPEDNAKYPLDPPSTSSRRSGKGGWP